MRISQPQSHQRFPLTTILGTGGNVRLLRVLAVHGGPLSAPRLARDAGLSPVGTRAALAGLVEQGVVTALGHAHAHLYALNPAHPLTAPIQALFAQERSQWDALQEDLRAVLARFHRVKAAWLYGSAARGEDRPGSDLDIALAVAGDEEVTTAESVREAMQSIEDRYQVVISIIALTPADILNRVETDPWWAEVARDGLALKAAAPERYVSQLRRAAVTA